MAFRLDFCDRWRDCLEHIKALALCRLNNADTTPMQNDQYQCLAFTLTKEVIPRQVPCNAHGDDRRQGMFLEARCLQKCIRIPSTAI